MSLSKIFGMALRAVFCVFFIGSVAAARAAVPTFHLAWQETLNGLPRRAAVADVVGDGTLRLVTLDEQPNQKNAGTLTVRKWDGKTFVTEFTAPVAASAEKLAVGKFAGAKQPAVIVTANALWYWDGKQFAHKDAAQTLDLLGATRLRNGEERVLILGGPHGAKAYRVDTSAAGTGWLTDGIDSPASAQVAWGDMHAAPQFFSDIGLPPAVAGGGLIGIWDVRNSGGLFLYYAKIDPQYAKKPDPKDSKKTISVITGWSYYIAFQDAQATTQAEHLVTPKLDGPPYDVALVDPKGSGKTGLLVLTGNAATGKARSLYFFALD